MWLADSLSAELLSQGHGIQVVDRSRLREYLVREHIPSSALKDREAARWLAAEFQANVVLLGTIEQLGEHFNFLTELLNIPNDKVGPQEAMQIAIPEPQETFVAFEPYHEDSPGSKITPHPGSAPAQYTDAARNVKFNAAVILEVTVTEAGRAGDISVVKGAPYGLNEAVIKAVSSWKFRPAAYEGKPIATRVPIETTFRLY